MKEKPWKAFEGNPARLRGEFRTRKEARDFIKNYVCSIPPQKGFEIWVKKWPLMPDSYRKGGEPIG